MKMHLNRKFGNDYYSSYNNIFDFFIGYKGEGYSLVNINTKKSGDFNVARQETHCDDNNYLYASNAIGTDTIEFIMLFEAKKLIKRPWDQWDFY